MMNKEDVLKKIISIGAYKASFVLVKNINFDNNFIKLCESNACGNYNKNWMCPPTVGKIEELIKGAKKYKEAIVYQIVGKLEDSYDFEGMMKTGKTMNKLTRNIREYFKDEFGSKALYLGAGGCRYCETCLKLSNNPCPYPNEAIASLEAYGIDVSNLAKLANMSYINGENTVTYFGIVFLENV